MKSLDEQSTFNLLFLQILFLVYVPYLLYSSRLPYSSSVHRQRDSALSSRVAPVPVLASCWSRRAAQRFSGNLVILLAACPGEVLAQYPLRGENRNGNIPFPRTSFFCNRNMIP